MFTKLVPFAACATCAGCLVASPPLPATGSFHLSRLPASVQIRLAPATYALRYLPANDWDQVAGQLLHGGVAVAAATGTATPAADGRGRVAALGFPPVDPGSGYELHLQLLRAGHVLGTGNETSLTLASGVNQLVLDHLPEPAAGTRVPAARGLGPYLSTVPDAGLGAQLASAQDVLAADADHIYFLDNGRLGLVYRDARGQLDARTLAGADQALGAGLVDGPGETARFGNPRHLALAGPNTVYVADAGANAIRRVDLDARGEATVTTVAGNGTAGYADGPATGALFNAPSDLVLSPQGDLVVADTGNHLLRRLQLSQQPPLVTTYAGTTTAGFADGPATGAQFKAPTALAFGSSGTLFVGDAQGFRIRAVAPDALGNLQVTTAAGTGRQAGFQATLADDDGPGATARIGKVAAIKPASDGSLLFDDGQLRHLGFDASGAASVGTVGTAGTVTSDFPPDALSQFTAAGLGFDADGDVLLAAQNRIKRVVLHPDGSSEIRQWLGPLAATTQPFDGPLAHDTTEDTQRFGIAVDQSGHLFYVTSSAVYMLPTANLEAAPVLVAGDASITGHQDGVGSQARFQGLAEVLCAPDGSLFLTSVSTNAVRRLVVDPISGMWTSSTVAGSELTAGYRDGDARSALFFRLGSLDVDSNGSLFVCDTVGLIRKIQQNNQGTWTVSTVAGQIPQTNAAGQVISAHGGYLDGQANLALLAPTTLIFDRSGNIIFSNAKDRLRKLTFMPNGQAEVTTIAGQSNANAQPGDHAVDGIGTAATFNQIELLALDRNGDVLITDTTRIRRLHIDAFGRAVVTTVLGSRPGSSDGPLGQGLLGDFGNDAGGLAVSPEGDIYFTEYFGSISRLRRISSP